MFEPYWLCANYRQSQPAVENRREMYAGIKPMVLNDVLGSGCSLGFRSSVHSLKCLQNANTKGGATPAHLEVSLMFNAQIHLHPHRLCSLVGTNPSVSPRRSGQLSDCVPLCLAFHQGACLMSRPAPLRLSARRFIHLAKTTKEKMVAAARCVCCYFGS